MKTCPDCGCRVYEYGCVNCDEADYIEMQALDDLLKAPCGRCGSPECFGGCEVGVDGGHPTASGNDTPADPKERTGVADD
jgi:hypothetical protein